MDLTIWVGWSARELGIFKDVVAGYEKTHPNVTVTVRGSVNDDKIIAAIRGGNVPDVVSSFTSSNVGRLHDLGGVDRPRAAHVEERRADLDVHARDHVLHAVQGHALRAAVARRHVRPLLQQDDVRQGGHHGAAEDDLGARRRREEADDAQPGRLAQGRGLRPVLRLLRRHAADDRHLRALLRRASTPTTQGHSILSKDPGWADLLHLAEELVDWYGYDNLVRWQAAQGDEFSASNAFEIGKIAMMIDGEWRVAFIAARASGAQVRDGARPGRRHPAGLYGSGYVNGTIIGIPKGAKNKDAAWDLLKYLTTDTHALVAVLERHPQRALHAGLAEVAGAQAGRELQDVPEHLRRIRSPRRLRSPPSARPTRR